MTTLWMNSILQSSPLSMTQTILLKLTTKIHPLYHCRPYDWSNDNIDDVCTLVNTGAMVTCTGTKHIIIHHYRPYTKVRRCPICLKAALSSNNSIIPEGNRSLYVCTAEGYQNILVYYHPSITGTLLSPTSVIDSAKDSNSNFTGQSIHRWFENDTMLSRKHDPYITPSPLKS